MTTLRQQSLFVATLAYLALLSLPCRAQTPASPPAALAQTRTLTLELRWDGELPPAPAKVKFDAAWAERNPDEAGLCGRCAEEGRLVHEVLLVDRTSRGIANVACSIAGLEGNPAALAEPLLDNLECRFSPRVQFIAAGSALRIRNSDPFAHTARLSDGKSNLLWNALIATSAESKTCVLPRAGTYLVMCDMHPWMRAHVIATKHPFVAVSDAKGTARIAGIPPDAEKLNLVLWHEKLGTLRRALDFSGVATKGQDAGVLALQLTQRDLR